MIAVIGIERAVVVQPSVHGLDNTATLDAIKNSAGKFRGVGRIDDKTPKSELQRLHDNGIRGVRFNLLDRPRGNIKLDVLDRCVENIARVRLVRRPSYRHGQFTRAGKAYTQYARPGGHRPYRAGETR